MRLLVNSRQVDLSEDCPVSIQYTLNSETDLSSFTTTYSSELTLPLTNANRITFNHPDPSITQAVYPYQLFNDTNELVDEGSLMVNSVDDSIHCHLYGTLVSLNDELQGFSTLGSTLRGNTAINALGSSVSLSDIPLQSSSFNLTSGVLHLGSTNQNLLNFYKANIGKPSDFDCSHEYNTTTTPPSQDDIGERTVLSAPSLAPTQSHQYRTYQLTPAIPALVLFYNLFNASSYDVTISNEARTLLQNIGYVSPSLKSVFDFKTTDYQWVKSTSVTATSLDFKVKDILSTNYVGLTADETVAHYFLIKVSNGSSTYKVLYYPDLYGWNEQQFMEFSTESYNEAIKFNDRTSIVSMSSLNSPVTPATYTIEYSTFVIDRTTEECTEYNNILYRDSSVAYTFTPSYYVSSAASLQFSYQTYYSSVPKPWDICKSICKKFNLRLKQTGYRSFLVVPTSNYYNTTPLNIISYTDASGDTISPCVFSSKKLVFYDRTVDSLWFTTYKSKFDKVYGQANLVTNYSIESESNWSETNLKIFVSPNYTYYPYNSTTSSIIQNIGEAYNESGSQVDVSGSLCVLSSQIASGVYICDDQLEEKQCWYKTTSLSSFKSIPNAPHLMSCNAAGISQFTYGQALANPSGYTAVANAGTYFKDVIDSSNSSTLTTKVFIDKLHKPIHEFITSIFAIHNQYWVVGSIDSYVPGVDNLTKVTFIKINNLANYLPSGNVTVTASSESTSKGTVSPASQSVAIGSQATVIASPASFFRFDHWSDGSSQNPHSFTVTQSTHIIAYFVQEEEYYLDVAEPEAHPGTVVTTIAGTPYYGTISEMVVQDTPVTVEYTPEGTETCTGWYEHMSGTTINENPYTLPGGIQADTDLAPIVVEAPTTYSIRVSTAIGSVSGTFNGTPFSGNFSTTTNAPYTLVVQWNAGSSGKEFVRWKDLSVSPYQYYYTNPYTFTGRAANIDIYPEVRTPVTGFKLTSSSGSNLESFAVTYADDTPYVLGTTVEAGTNLHITARAMEGDFLECWSDTIAGDVIVEYPLDFWINLQANVNLNANISQGERMHIILPEEGDGEYTIPYFQDYYDAVYLNGGDNFIDLPAREEVDLYCYDPQDPLYEFDYWYTQDEEEIHSQFVTVEVTSGLEYEAYYKLKAPYTLSLDEIQHGSISVSVNGSAVTLPVSVSAGDVVTATNTPATGYTLQYYTINGNQTSLPYTIQGNTIIGAQFQVASTFNGFKLYDGTVLQSGATLSVWEHNTVNPIWLLTDAPMSSVTYSVGTSNFSVQNPIDNLLLLGDTLDHNDNVRLTDVLTVVIGGVTYTLNIILNIEYQGDSVLFNSSASVFNTYEIPASGYSNTISFYNGEGWYGRSGSSAPPVDAFLPTASSGYGASGNEWASDYTFDTDNLDDFVVTTSIVGMDYSAYTISNPSRDYLNLDVSVSMPANTSGSTKYYLLKVTSPFFHAYLDNNIPSVIVFYQRSN